MERNEFKIGDVVHRKDFGYCIVNSHKSWKKVNTEDGWKKIGDNRSYGVHNYYYNGLNDGYTLRFECERRTAGDIHEIEEWITEDNDNRSTRI